VVKVLPKIKKIQKESKLEAVSKSESNLFSFNLEKKLGDVSDPTPDWSKKYQPTQRFKKQNVTDSDAVRVLSMGRA